MVSREAGLGMGASNAELNSITVKREYSLTALVAYHELLLVLLLQDGAVVVLRLRGHVREVESWTTW